MGNRGNGGVAGYGMLDNSRRTDRRATSVLVTGLSALGFELEPVRDQQ
jgi:hypothetical protein